MKIDKNTPINHNGNRGLKTGAQAVGYVFGGKTGAQIAGKVADSKPVQQVVNKMKNQPKKNEKASQKLQNSLSKRVGNVFNSRRKNKKSENTTSDNNDVKEDNTSNEEEEEQEKKVKKKKVKLVLKIFGAVAPVLGVFLLIVVVISAISSIFPFLIPGAIAEDRSMLTKENGFSDEQIAYYNKLFDVADKYQKKCNEDLKYDIIHTSLIYYYYQTGVEDIDYNRMKNNIDMVYNLVPSTCGVDYGVDGEFYNNLKNSSSFRNYYSSLLNEKSMDDILKEIFEIGNEISVSNDVSNDNFIPENTKVNISGSSSSYNGYSNGSSGSSSGGNSGTKEDPSKITNVSFKDYLLGVIYANVSLNEYSNTEKMKALVVLYTTNIIAKNNLVLSNSTISLNNNDILYCNADYGCSYNDKKNLQIGPGKAGNGNNMYFNGQYYYLKALDMDVKSNLNTIINEVYGQALVNKSGGYESVDITSFKANGKDYKEMLINAYGNLSLKNLRENVYIDGVNFGTEKVKTTAVFYDQSDYANYKFCGLKKETIASSGCGITAMAMVLSTYEFDKKYDPIYMNNVVTSMGQCSKGNGTHVGFFRKEANALGYKYLNVGKKTNSDKNLILSHLREGHLIIIHVIGPNIFTKGGHYMVLSGIDPDTGKVYVYDPNNKNNSKYRNSGNGWYSFNDVIIPAAKGDGAFHIIWKG